MFYQALVAATAALICGLAQLLFSYIVERRRLKKFESDDSSIPRFFYNGRFYDLFGYVRDKANSLDSRWLKTKTIPGIIETYERKISAGTNVYYNTAIMNAYKLLAYKVR